MKASTQIVLTVALACAAITFFLVLQINQTRLALQEDGIDIYNYAMQNDRNFDNLSIALHNFRQDQQAGIAVDNSQYIMRFDVLWSVFNVIDTRWLRAHADLPTARQFVGEGKSFIARYEDRFVADVQLSDNEINSIIDQSNALSDKANGLGHDHYERSSRIRDDISQRMLTLTRAFWFFSALLLATGLAWGIQLRRARHRVTSLLQQSNSTQAQLAKALEERRSGDIERKAQNRFIAAASHDLRQPLHALSLYLSALQSHVTTEKGTHLLGNVNRSTEALTQLLDSLLDISKLDAGVVDIDMQVFPLSSMLNPLEHEFAADAKNRGLTLQFDHSDVWVLTDRVLLDRIVRNLVTNALNYTPHGTVSVSAEEADGQVTIVVEDTGLGIPKIEQQAIFNEYYQLNNPERDRTKGLGLGLSIVRRLTRLLNIELSIESEVGAGSRFFLQVTAAEPGEATAPVVPWNAAANAGDVRGLRILVIDDELDVREGMDSLLTQMHCEILTADAADTACQLLIEKEIVPDLIIADYRLRDERTGDEAINLVREEVNEDVPAMIITGDTSPERIKEANASGFLLLHKPVSTDELIDSIRLLTEGERYADITG